MNIKPNVTYCNFKLTIAVSVLFLLIIGNVSQAKSLYKWVDENGNVSYQDQPPPKDLAVKQEILKDSITNSSNLNGSTPSPEQSNPVIVYTIDNCDPCEIVLLRLKQLGIPNQKKSLLDRDIQARVLDLSGSISAPTIFIGDKLVSDISDKNLTTELKAAGYTIKEQTTSKPETLDE